uniref:Uncharacterized protein n=1 Tax=Arundo donax TaxID=35708 RepID=A0A0A9FLK2_ARUDO
MLLLRPFLLVLQSSDLVLCFAQPEQQHSASNLRTSSIPFTELTYQHRTTIVNCHWDKS